MECVICRHGVLEGGSATVVLERGEATLIEVYRAKVPVPGPDRVFWIETGTEKPASCRCSGVRPGGPSTTSTGRRNAQEIG